MQFNWSVVLCCTIQFYLQKKMYYNIMKSIQTPANDCLCLKTNVFCSECKRVVSRQLTKSKYRALQILWAQRVSPVYGPGRLRGIKRHKQEEDDQSLTPTFLFDLYQKTSACQKLAHTELQRRHHMPGMIVIASFSYFHSLITIRSLPAGRRLNV